MNIGIYNIYDDTTLVYAGDDTFALAVGDAVVFRHGDKAELFGHVRFIDRTKLDNEILLDGAIIRRATTDDEMRHGQLAMRSLDALELARAKVTELALTMSILHAATAFDESEINFFFAADERIDFRELVPRLAGALKKRVHLQQIGARDRAKVVGGYGMCGREQCCTTGIVSTFRSITMEMARLQELAMKGNDKLSGNCGKLLCCLAYEVDLYAELRKTMPAYGSEVTLKSNETAKVIGLDILNQMVKLYLTGSGVRTVPVGEITSSKRMARPAKIKTSK